MKPTSGWLPAAGGRTNSASASEAATLDLYCPGLPTGERVCSGEASTDPVMPLLFGCRGGVKGPPPPSLSMGAEEGEDTISCTLDCGLGTASPSEPAAAAASDAELLVSSADSPLPSAWSGLSA